MSFDPRSAEAAISLGKIDPENLPAVAWDALEAGYDGQAVCLMAALQRPTGWATDRLLPAFMQETGMRLLSRQEASIRFAAELARDILDSRKDPLKDLPTLARLCYEAEYPQELMGLYQLDDEVYLEESTYGRPADEVRSDVRDELIILARNQRA